jgi:AmmeMemoRadiSam system protein B
MTASKPSIRHPAVAGTFYPGQGARLKAEVIQLLAEAQDASLPPVRGLIVPHAGYRYSGPVAASGFRQLQAEAGRTHRVYLLGPAHYVHVYGVGVAPYDAFETPLGLVSQDQAAIAALDGLGPTYRVQAAPHEPEHCLEVELPFLQQVLGDFKLVAMLCGQPPVEQVAQDLALRLHPEDLVVVSSDLSHFHGYETARQLDKEFLGSVLAGDLARVAKGEACGLQPILILMRLAQLKGWEPTLLDYRNSGDTGGDPWRVVGYAAVAYTEASP